jgi:hypothetical protein
MTNLTWDPYREMMSFRSAIDRMLTRDFQPPGGLRGQLNWSPLLDLAETSESTW